MTSRETSGRRPAPPSSGITAGLFAILVIVVLVIAGLAAYFAVGGSGPSGITLATSATTTPSQGSILFPASSGSSSSTASTTSAESPSASTVPYSSLVNGNDVYGNFSALSIRYVSTCMGLCTKTLGNANPTNTSLVMSYSYVGTRPSNSVNYNVYDYTLTDTSTGASQSEEYLLNTANEAEGHFTGQTNMTSATSSLAYLQLLLSVHSNGLAGGQRVGQTSTTLSGVPLTVTTYSLGSSGPITSGVTGDSSTTLETASITGTNVVFPLFLHTVIVDSGSNIQLVQSFQVLSMTVT